nr:UPF0481 protein At3g47200-like [Ziziphus jujuba var. spinosa]
MEGREEGCLIFEEELSAERTIIRDKAEDSNQLMSQSNPPKQLLNIVIEPVGNSATSSLVSLDEWLNAIIKPESDASAGSNVQLKRPAAKIRKVPGMLRDIESNEDCYDPMVVSIGPYHHGKPQLQEIENLKTKLTKQFVADISGEPIHALYDKVKEVAMEARGYYDCREMEADGEDMAKFTRMMFLDGCFILQYIYLMIDEGRRTKIGMKNHLVAFVQRDLFLLENQLPYIVLEALMSMRFEDGDEGKAMIDKFIKQTQSLPPPQTSIFNRNFQFRSSSSSSSKSKQKASAKSSPGQAPPKSPGGTKAAADLTDRRGGSAEPGEAPKSSDTKVVADTQAEPRQQVHVHLLDIRRKSFVSVPERLNAERGKNSKSESEKSKARTHEWYSYRSAKELKTVGIRFKASESVSFSDVHFASRFLLSGELKLPPLTVDDSTKSLLLNMVAFEMSPDGPDDFCVTSYICLMDSLLDHVEDVIELRNRDILMNYLGSDQQVADLFNDISKNLVPHPHVYHEVKYRIEEHYKNRVKIWMADWLHTHFSSPWTVLAFVGAIFAIILSLIQTYLAANPPK